MSDALREFEDWLEYEAAYWRERREALKESDSRLAGNSKLLANRQGKTTAYETAVSQFDQMMAALEREDGHEPQSDAD